MKFKHWAGLITACALVVAATVLPGWLAAVAVAAAVFVMLQWAVPRS